MVQSTCVGPQQVDRNPSHPLREINNSSRAIDHGDKDAAIDESVGGEKGALLGQSEEEEDDDDGEGGGGGRRCFSPTLPPTSFLRLIFSKHA